MAKHKRINQQSNNIKLQNQTTVTNNCTVILKSICSEHVIKIRISTINGFDHYKYLIGRAKGSKVNINHRVWMIEQIVRDTKKKRFRRKYSLLSHPLNNSTHYLRYNISNRV